jgi:transcriptional regulator with XRE-family HTH domain
LPRCHLTLKCPKPRRKDYPEEPKTLGEHLKRRRLDLGLRQRDVAVEIGVTAETFCKWELGRAEPLARLIPAIHRFLGFCLYEPAWTFAERLRVAREAQGLSRRHVARLAGVDEATVGRAELGRKGVARRCVLAISAAVAGRRGVSS